jgi:hypothetical protein
MTFSVDYYASQLYMNYISLKVQLCHVVQKASNKRCTTKLMKYIMGVQKHQRSDTIWKSNAFFRWTQPTMKPPKLPQVI